MISAAVVAAAMGLVPSVAQADGPSDRVLAATAAKTDLSKSAVSSAAKSATFSSPAERSVRTAAPAAPKAPAAKSAPSAVSGAAAAPTVATVDNPDLGVGLYAFGTSAHGIQLESYVTSSVTAQIRVDIQWGDGQTTTEWVTHTADVIKQHVYSEVGTYTVKVTVTDTTNNVAEVNQLAITTAGTEFTPHAPTRLLDTRDGTGAASAAAVAPFGTVRVKVGGNSGIPAGVSAVALNLTVTNTASGGHITAYPSGEERPTTSNVNFVAGQTVPNMSIVPVGEDGYVELYNRSGGQADLIADVTGYFTSTAASGYTSLDPVRIVDSREGQGTPAKRQINGQESFGVQITGKAGVPAGGVKAVALNVTVTDPKSAGHLTVYPGGQQAPITSNLNFTAGLTVANSVIVPVGPDGKINVRNGAWAATDVIVDVVGYYSTDSKAAYLPVAPTRLLDTRELGVGQMPGREILPLPLSFDEPSIKAYALNATVTDTRGSGHLTVFPDPNTMEQYENGTAKPPVAPNSSNLNWSKDATVPNLVQASTGKTGIVDFFNGSWHPTDLVIDMFGLYDQN
ncbi:hypothetical protein [Streptomyces sp. NPDC090022]|uniref:hypothetical protein n=1 Tax=Streptomyces sp. NPDC090022 TaxID=3365920 RepID=UPI003829420D